MRLFGVAVSMYLGFWIAAKPTSSSRSASSHHALLCLTSVKFFDGALCAKMNKIFIYLIWSYYLRRNLHWWDCACWRICELFLRRLFSRFTSSSHSATFFDTLAPSLSTTTLRAAFLTRPLRLVDALTHRWNLLRLRPLRFDPLKLTMRWYNSQYFANTQYW